MHAQIVQLIREALWLVLALSAPPIIAASVVGLLVAFFQAATQLQEQTTAYALKFISVCLALLLSGALIGSSLYHFADRLFLGFPLMTRQ
jgi:type III secretion protein S